MNKLAIKGGKPVRNKKHSPWPVWPIHDRQENKVVLEVLNSGKWSFGEKIKEFEEKFSSFQDAKYGICANSGTSALEAALVSSGIGPGCEVIITPYTFVATATSVLRANAVPIFVDIEEDTFNISPDKIEEAITGKTKAIVPVHLGGLPCDMDRILEIARKYNLIVVEDACHSWGSKWKEKGTGSIGYAGVFSFQMSKNITCAEGGIVITNDKEMADRCRSFINIGRYENKPWYEHHILGANYRMTDIQAAILLIQLSRLEKQNQIRKENAGYLNDKLSQVEGLKILQEDSRVTRRAYHMYIFKYIQSEFNDIARGKFIEALNAEGVPCIEGYPFPLYKNPLFINWKGSGPEFCPISCPYYGRDIDYAGLKLETAERICSKEAIWLRQNILLGTKRDMKDIINAIYKIKENVNELL